MLSIGWFSTGRGEGSRGLLQFVQDRLLRAALDARIEFIFSNCEPGEAEGSDQFFQLVRDYSLPLITYSSSRFRRAKGGPIASHREEYDQRVMDLLAGYHPDICVLAGYMLIVGAAMCRRYPLLNLHPALPDGPKGSWRDVIWSLIENRATHTGAMVHLATEDVDRGPVVAYCTVPITGGPFDSLWRNWGRQDVAQVKSSIGEDSQLFQEIRQTEYRREPYLLFETLRAVAQEQAIIRDGQVLDQAGRPFNGLCLDREIDLAMAGEV